MAGGLYFRKSSAVMENNTVSGNHADGEGSAMYLHYSSSVDMGHTTIASNTNPITSSVIYLFANGFTDAVFTMTNSIVDQTVGSNCSLPISGGGHNIDRDGSCDLNGSSIVMDPQLRPLADNGGGVLTHAIESDSPAVDAGAHSDVTIDQRGEARPQGQAADIGAYELEAVSYTFGVSNSGDSLALDWSEIGDDCDASLFSSDTPFGGYNLLAVVTEDTADVVLTPDENSYYYLDLENCAGGTDLAPSSFVGVFNFGVENGE